MNEDDALFYYFESDFGVMKLPIPISIKWTKENPVLWDKAQKGLIDFMDAMWVGGFNFDGFTTEREDINE